MDSAILFISFTKNNIFFTLTNLKGEVLKATSLGRKQPKNLKKLTATFSQFTTLLFIDELKCLGYNLMHVKFCGFNKSRRSIVKVLKRSSLQVATIHDVTTNPHNGCRLAKKRRL